MDYLKCFESVPEGKKPENKYQYNGIGTVRSWLVFMLYNDNQSDNKAEFINGFLNYHFSKYTGNPEQFFLCLRDIKSGIESMKHTAVIPEVKKHYSRIFDLYNPIIEKWILKAEKKPQQRKSIDTLKKACKNDENKIKDIKAWFIQNGLCDPGTFVWKDRKSGYMKILVGYIKDLEIKGYTEHLTDIDILNIALNSFGVEIKISTIQHNKAYEYSEIPPFLTK